MIPDGSRGKFWGRARVGGALRPDFVCRSGAALRTGYTRRRDIQLRSEARKGKKEMRKNP